MEKKGGNHTGRGSKARITSAGAGHQRRGRTGGKPADSKGGALQTTERLSLGTKKKKTQKFGSPGASRRHVENRKTCI